LLWRSKRNVGNIRAMPVHLLTKEAFKTYQRHLKTNGIIAIHITNRSLNLEPVVMNLARHFNYKVAVVDHVPPPDQWWVSASVWMLLQQDGKILDTDAIRLTARPPLMGAASIPLWTDDFASLFQILRSRSGAQDNPEFTDAQSAAAYSLIQQGDFAGAVNCYRQALETVPHSPILLNNLAWLLATCPEAKARNGIEAVRLAEEACQLTHNHTVVTVGTLAAAYAEAGRFDDAIATAEKACALASEPGKEDLLKRNQELLALYLKHRPYHEPVEKLVPAAP
jgi:tetratricopeptide (TPR) repeat protein